MQVVSGLGDSLEEGMATLSNILAWRILWTEEPARLQSIGSQRVGQDWSNSTCTQWTMSIYYQLYALLFALQFNWLKFIFKQINLVYIFIHNWYAEKDFTFMCNFLFMKIPPWYSETKYFCKIVRKISVAKDSDGLIIVRTKKWGFYGTLIFKPK